MGSLEHRHRCWTCASTKLYCDWAASKSTFASYSACSRFSCYAGKAWSLAPLCGIAVYVSKMIFLETKIWLRKCAVVFRTARCYVHLGWFYYAYIATRPFHKQTTSLKFSFNYRIPISLPLKQKLASVSCEVSPSSGTQLGFNSGGLGLNK